MADTEYTPPKVWSWNKPNSTMGRFANINRPTAGAQQEKELPVGKHPLQLYSQGTPNGVKVTIMLEELLAKGHKGVVWHGAPEVLGLPHFNDLQWDPVYQVCVDLDVPMCLQARPRPTRWLSWRMSTVSSRTMSFR